LLMTPRSGRVTTSVYLSTHLNVIDAPPIG